MTRCFTRPVWMGVYLLAAPRVCEHLSGFHDVMRHALRYVVCVNEE